MSQAQTNIGAGDTQGNSGTVMGEAMRAARPRKSQGKKQQPGKTDPRRSATQSRPAITYEDAERLCPHQGLADNLARTFALDGVDMTAIREAMEQHVIQTAEVLQGALNERAMAMHLQRIVGAYVGSAYGAGSFYTQKVTVARDETTKIANDHRDEDRDGVLGFESKAARARQFAAEMGLQAAALLAAADGAVHAYEHVVGEAWKPYQSSGTDSSRTVTRRAATEEMAAFGG
ncbi:hypothetical protein [Plastoroseomonas hellenica]|uniref:hypothetical protein n=1 Tax=Plastoroseomonas hellenica TaxID=2687306 RepID=UPI001BAB27A0|nr:hypothetical protein [Plastoroseomonas hellenica]